MADRFVLHDEIYTHPQTKKSYAIEVHYDDSTDSPVDVFDGGHMHGVLEWLDFDPQDEDEWPERITNQLEDDYKMRLPLFRRLEQRNHGYYGASLLYYDFVASLNRAVEVWGTKPEDAEQAVEQDFAYLRGWYNDEWHWVTVRATPLDDEGEPDIEFADYMGGIESLAIDKREELEFIINDIICGIEGAKHNELHKNQMELF